MHFHITFHDTLIFLTGVAIPTYNLMEWVVKHFGKRIRRLFIRTPQEEALYLQYKELAARKK